MIDPLIASITSSKTDVLLRERGYDLLAEYLQIIRGACFEPDVPILELATGTGRTVALLARLGYKVTTGDLTDEKRSEAMNRITPAYAEKVSMIAADMERLPFADGSMRNIISLNTLHELDHPLACVQELVRVHHPEGTLVIGDFNETGFDVMQELHQLLYGHDHPRGTLPMQELEPILRDVYGTVDSLATELNATLICRRKKRS